MCDINTVWDCAIWSWSVVANSVGVDVWHQHCLRPRSFGLVLGVGVSSALALLRWPNFPLTHSAIISLPLTRSFPWRNYVRMLTSCFSWPTGPRSGFYRQWPVRRLQFIVTDRSAVWFLPSVACTPFAGDLYPASEPSCARDSGHHCSHITVHLKTVSGPYVACRWLYPASEPSWARESGHHCSDITVHWTRDITTLPLVRGGDTKDTGVSHRGERIHTNWKWFRR